MRDLSTPFYAIITDMMATSDGIERLRKKLIEQHRKDSQPEFTFYTDLKEIKAIISDYYHHEIHELKDLDNYGHPKSIAIMEAYYRGPATNAAPRGSQFRIKPKEEIPTTGQSIRERLLWSQIDQIFSSLNQTTVRVGDMAITGWYTYALQRWVGHGKEDEQKPEVTQAHIESALRVFCKRIEGLL